MTVIIAELSTALQSAGVDQDDANTASAAVFAAILQQHSPTLQQAPMSALAGPAEVDSAAYDKTSDADWEKLPLDQRGQILFGVWPLTQPVKLDKKNDPRFQRKYKTLKEGNCEWDKTKFHWCPPSS